MKYIEESILNYIKKENTNYAILLNGKWGSGKTYFFENSLKLAIENTDFNGKKKKTIYLSLYGISSLEEINKRIVLDNLLTSNDKVMNFLDSKWGGRITEVAKTGFEYIKTLDIPVFKDIVDTKINYENLLNFTDKVLVLDDLERANLDITDILGYINNFVEHDGVKVVIIGYEDEIAEKLIHRNLELKMLVSSIVLEKEKILQRENDRSFGKNQESEISTSNLIENKMNELFHRSNEYKRIKEKLIGKTLTLLPDYPALINNIVTQVGNNEIRDFLIQNIECVINVFKDSRTDNIRILKQGLDDFELIYSKFKEDYSELGEDVLLSILIYTLAVSFEIKSGQEGNGDLEGVTSDVFFLIGFNRTNKNYKEKYIEKFIKKYSLSTYKAKGVSFFPFAERLVRKGILDLEKFSEEMKAILANMGQDIPLYLRLIRDNFQDLTDEEFIEATRLAYEKLINGEVHFVLYFRAFNLFRYFIEKGLFKKDLQDVKTELLNGLELSGMSGEYYSNLDTYFIGTNIEQQDYDLLEFKEKVISINTSFRLKSEEQRVQELMTYLDSDFRKFLYEMRERFFYVPVFDKYNVDDLFKKVLSLTNSDTVSFSLLLEKRYAYKEDIKNYKLYLEEESLTALQSKIKMFINGKEKTLKMTFLQDLSHSIEKVVAQMKLT
ncbi:P-loop NTPase fold protein [Gottfriedia acidiceleris]|uniref:P-loop NTPase fold protein n=1 Tax=Gottfriedia acidiceleris TaxID=371036 RepID=UPI003D240B63